MSEGPRDDRGDSQDRTARPPLSPLRAFTFVLIVAILGAGIAWTMWSDEPSDDGARATPPPSLEEDAPSPSPTAPRTQLSGPSEDEALTIFSGLRDGLERVYRLRDRASLRDVVEPGSAQFDSVLTDLRVLVRNNLLDRTRTKTLGLDVVEAGAGRIVVRESVLIRPRYLDDATYVEVDVDLRRNRVTSEWTIENEGDGWLIVGSRRS